MTYDDQSYSLQPHFSTCSGVQSDLLVYRYLNLQEGLNKTTRRLLEHPGRTWAKYKLLDRARLRPLTPLLVPNKIHDSET